MLAGAAKAAGLVDGLANFDLVMRRLHSNVSPGQSQSALMANERLKKIGGAPIDSDDLDVQIARNRASVAGRMRK